MGIRSVIQYYTREDPALVKEMLHQVTLRYLHDAVGGESLTMVRPYQMVLEKD